MNRRNFIALAATTIAGAFIAAKQAPAAALVIPNSNQPPEGYAFVFDPHPLRFKLNAEGDNYEQVTEYDFPVAKNPNYFAAPFELRIACKVKPEIAGDQFLSVMIRRVMKWEEFENLNPPPLTFETMREIAAQLHN